MSEPTVHAQILESMKEMRERASREGVTLNLPSPSSQTLGAIYTEVELGKKLTAEFKFNHSFSNPMGFFQGGFLCAALDEVFGPLTYMVAQKPVVTIEMSTSFLRPFTEKTEVVIIKAELVEKTKTLLVLKAEVRTREGKLIATSSNHSLVVSDDKLAR